MALSLLICIIGLIVFALASEGPARARVAVIALHMFWVGLLAYLIHVFKVVG